MGKYTELFKEMEEFAEQYQVPIISPQGGNLLVEIIKKQKPNRILEIGTAIGYSALLMEANMPCNGNIVTIEQNEERLAVARTFIQKAGAENKIQVLAGDAALVLSQIEGTFDMVFIDAAKGQYLDYLQKIIPHLAPGAVIIADNVLFRGWVLGENSPPKRFRTIVKRLKEYIEFIERDCRFETSIHETGDGMAISYYQGANYSEKT